ncbi:MAG: Lrp/AsnC ligand binding domain-containing protein [Theionarchaea archaeon]|nr:Lrp/AsnC ligand binding domain-containing protein [Theionarchaea archaeon]MBU7000228.1 Lrp/AsnC ligand binding domain-containing protein [Theionarchaea archaeon]MBU7036251.1 Lrp/AsnC ligand binding domain-containing protein [Theionarchaea archaeon]MBU7041521.1 Lrp/AsnC ligand binding domain-containing protein [Theionarchaea archaeon]
MTRLSFVAKCFEDVHEILGIKVEPGTEPAVIKELEAYPHVAAVYKSLGDYDIIALLSVEDSRELTEFVVENVRKLKGVVDTKTTLIRK